MQTSAMNSSDKGSVILRDWNAKRQAERDAELQAAALPLSSGSQGSELYELLTGAGVPMAGVAVNEHTAMGVSTVYACIALIAGAIATMPCNLYERTQMARKPIDVTKSTLAADLWWLLNEEPHPRFSAAVMWEYVVTSLLLHGDGFVRILRGSERHSSRVAHLLPVHPLNVSVLDDPTDPHRLIYQVWNNLTNRVDVVDQDDMLHIPGPGFDGYRGMSQLRWAAKRIFGISIAADMYQERFFSNGARPDFALLTEKKLDTEQAAVLRATWAAKHGGVEQSHLPAVLTGGMKLEKLTMSAADIEILSTRQFQVLEIARGFGVPPHMIGETEKASSFGTGIENLGRGFVRYTLSRHLTKLRQELNRKLFPRTLRWVADFDPASLEKGDAKARSEYFAKALGGNNNPGWLTKNEVRVEEGREPMEGSQNDTLLEWKPGGKDTNTDDEGNDGEKTSATAE